MTERWGWLPATRAWVRRTTDVRGHAAALMAAHARAERHRQDSADRDHAAHADTTTIALERITQRLDELTARLDALDQSAP